MKIIPADFKRQIAEFEAQQEANLWELAANANYHWQPFTQQPQESQSTIETSPRTFWSRLNEAFHNKGASFRDGLGEYLFQTPLGGGEIPVILTLMGKTAPKNSRPEIPRPN